MNKRIQQERLIDEILHTLEYFIELEYSDDETDRRILYILDNTCTLLEQLKE